VNAKVANVDGIDPVELGLDAGDEGNAIMLPVPSKSRYPMIDVGREAAPEPVTVGNVIAVGLTINAYKPVRFETEHPFWYSARTSLIARPEPVEVGATGPLGDWRALGDTRSISAPRPRTIPANWVTDEFVPNGSISDMLTEQSEFTLYVPTLEITVPMGAELAKTLPPPSSFKAPA
jgi:hypothetical protein